MTYEEYTNKSYKKDFVFFRHFIIGLKYDIDNKPIKSSSYERHDLMFSVEFYDTILK